MSDKPFVHSEQALELIDKMLDDENYAGKLDDGTLDAFEDMRVKSREHGAELTSKQRLWVQSKALQLDMLEEPATNEWSSKTLQERERIRGKEVATPPALLNKALRPPHRMHELDKKKEEA